MTHRLNDFVAAGSLLGNVAQHGDDLLSLRSRIEQPDGAHCTTRTNLVDIKFFHKGLIRLRRFVTHLLALFHERFIGLRMRLHDVRADIDAQMTILVAQPRVWVAFLQIDQPTFDAMCHHMILRDRVARAVPLADVAVHAEVLNAKLARLIFYQWQVGGHESWPKACAEFFVDQAAMAAELAETHLIKNRNRLHLAGAVVVRHRGISHLAYVGSQGRGDLGALRVRAHRFLLYRVRPPSD